MKIVYAGLIVLVSAVVAACSSGSVSPSVTQGSLPTSIAYLGAPVQIPFSQGQYSGTLTLPASPVTPISESITLLTSLAPFSVPPTLQIRSLRNIPSAPTDTPLIYFELTSSGSFVLSSQPAFQVVLPSNVNPSNGPFFVAFFDPESVSAQGASPWNLTLEGPATVNGSTLTFSPGPSPFTVKANVNYDYIVYQVVATPSVTPSPSPSPSPTPSPSPAPTPPGVLGLSSSTISLLGVGQNNAVQTTLQETGYVGLFGEIDTCSPAIASIGLSSETGPTSTIAVTGIANGTCTATFSDSFGQSAILTVHVTVSGFIISTRVR